MTISILSNCDILHVLKAPEWTLPRTQMAQIYQEWHFPGHRSLAGLHIWETWSFVYGVQKCSMLDSEMVYWKRKTKNTHKHRLEQFWTLNCLGTLNFWTLICHLFLQGCRFLITQSRADRTQSLGAAVSRGGWNWPSEWCQNVYFEKLMLIRDRRVVSS